MNEWVHVLLVEKAADRSAITSWLISKRPHGHFLNPFLQSLSLPSILNNLVKMTYQNKYDISFKVYIFVLPPFDQKYRLLIPYLLLLFDDVSGW